ncbi:MAG: hypothetical protein LIO86_01975 [Lachnospiraceae bacterium]|nr:hypothetical protein [Lachnospiraceae bacterium]
MGALAYRIYQEKNNPVIYISADSYLSTNMGSGVEELDEAMQLLEQKAVGNVDTRILVVWDSSSYKMDVGRIRRILERLENRGRRFVMVCSSYAMYEADDKAVRNAYQFTENSERFEKCDSRVAQILDEYGCYIVRAVREMSDGEKDEFWEKVSEYSGIHEDEIERFKEKYKNENEIFNYYYYLLAVLRENLEEKLRTEQRIITPYVKRELSRMFGQIYNEEQSDKRSGAIYQALLRVGVDPRGISVDAEKEGMLSESDRTIEEKLDRFNTCVAMFSRFKLRIPYSLAYTFLTDSETVLPYSENGQKLYNIVTTSLPWIHYGVDAEGEFTFRFRNSLEADIYLENHDITGNQQVDLLCEIIDIYGEDYQRNRCKDPSFTKYLQSLLRFMGPNSTYVPFRDERKPEYQQIEKRLDRVIEKLEALQNVYGVPDEDAGFAVIIVAFTREYYGGLWSKWYGTSGKDLEPWIDDPEHFSKESYERRIKKLISAITLAESSAERIQIRLNMEYRERQHLYNQNYSLIVEAAQCNLRLEELMDEYKRFCLANHMAEDLELGKRKLSYCVLYQKLQKIIASDPLNGYAYNTLFKAFERTYEKENLSEALRLQYLSEIMQVVESCRTMDSEITSRGNRDELSVHLAKITSISEKVPITLESIREYRESSDHSNKDKKKQAFLVLFDEMLEANNPAAIAFVCQKELKIPSGGRRELNEDEFSSCERVYKFMKEEEHFACICSSKYSLAMMIRVCWMCYNRTTLTSTPECQITRMDETAWAEINQLCRSYSAVAGDDRQPLLMLVYALSTLQISHRSKNGYEETMNILRSINEMSFTNGRMRTPFMLCDETGTPYAYTGRGVHTRNKMNGFIHINEVPSFIQDKNGGIRFHLRNLGWKKGMPDESQVLKDLELGIGYTGFSVYTAAGRREREVGE